MTILILLFLQTIGELKKKLIILISYGALSEHSLTGEM